jgi:hypothetical protein
MKRKRTAVTDKPWTPFEPVGIPDDAIYTAPGAGGRPAAQYANSRYHVGVWCLESPTLGKYVHLSIKDHDRSARHDWRDLQRIKNELTGPQFYAVEVYPAEHALVDTCNQYHLYVFKDWQPDFGFKTRLVAEGNWRKSIQRPFPIDNRPVDTLSPMDFEKLYQRLTHATDQATDQSSDSATAIGDRGVELAEAADE